LENSTEVLNITHEYDTSLRNEFLSEMAKKYIWWETQEEALIFPQKILAQVMNLGTWDDSCTLVQLFSENELKNVIENAQAGQFRPRSWHFWCYRLIGSILPMPVRIFK